MHKLQSLFWQNEDFIGIVTGVVKEFMQILKKSEKEKRKDKNNDTTTKQCPVPIIISIQAQSPFKIPQQFLKGHFQCSNESGVQC